jgi:hypothetical protein
VSGDRESFGAVSVHAGASAYVACSTYEEAAPILSVHAGRLIVSITSAERKAVSEQAVTFARELASQAALFAAECERLHAGQHAQIQEAAAVDAA